MDTNAEQNETNLGNRMNDTTETKDERDVGDQERCPECGGRLVTCIRFGCEEDEKWDLQ